MNDDKDKIINAWLIEGPRPDIHRAIKEKLKIEWPTLYYAVLDFVK